MEKQICLYLKDGNKLTSNENMLLERINEILANREKSYNHFITSYNEILYRVFIDFKFNLPHYSYSNALSFQDFLNENGQISISNADSLSFMNFKNPIDVYHLKDIRLYNEMPLNEFEKFINDKKISLLFISNLNESTNEIDKFQLEDFIGGLHTAEIFRQNVFDVLYNDIKIYNGIIKKVETDVPSQRNYMIDYNGITLTSSEQLIKPLDSKSVLLYIFLINIDNMARAVKNRWNEIEDEISKNQKEFEKNKEIKLNELEVQIKSDDNFRACKTINMRMRYLKDLLKNEDDEVLEYLSMRRQFNGTIVTNSNEAQFWIERIWKELNK